MTALRPTDEAGVLAAVADAVATGTSLEILGAGSKRGLGRPVAAGRTLDLTGLSGVTFYEPEELVIAVRPGTPLAEVGHLLASRGQALAFEPPDLGPLYGAPADVGTIGGMIAANLSGPRRIKAGAARDHMLGIRAVSGRGEIFKSGGRVVKNVTGYDMSKGLTGSFGTLAVFTELTLKVLPAPQTATTLMWTGLADDAAVAVLSRALGSPADVSGAAHLPASVAADFGFSGPATLLRLEGIAPSVADRAARLAALLADAGPAEAMGGEPGLDLWRAIRDVAPFAATPGTVVWKISVAPTAGPKVVARLPAALPSTAGSRHFYDWGGGLVWLALDPTSADDAGAAAIRAAIAAEGGGHATLVRAPAELRARIPVFEPQPGPLAALTARLRAQFDPLGILNPGRMVAKD
ncbi:glycolate oxidase subunit GlcE [Methylobrevis pamukkalensis]|uniref:Putative FAD-linked oxidoreductase n=1 Tax=Methylobrevis pamukkalensis TaxID=1439726 RepID=A0A1E3H7F8_9HYPH|nr:glycolate oxidase subunit GlcE [Methylobrevis pamukkalensis]ODN71706.1 putative FAD-linked oxidoreductase [Methylobrevis pamukkalensis]